MDAILCIYIATISLRASKDSTAITGFILVTCLYNVGEAWITHPILLKRKQTPPRRIHK